MKKLIILNAENKGLGATFGLTPEREEIIVNHVSKVVEDSCTPEGQACNEGKGPSIGEVLVEGCAIAENEQEMAIICFTIGHTVGEMFANHMQKMMEMFSGMTPSETAEDISSKKAENN